MPRSRRNCSTRLVLTELERREVPATLRIATYNMEADINGDTTPLPGFYQVLEGIGEEQLQGDVQPVDIVTLEETTSNSTTVAPIVTNLNSYYNGLAVYAQSSYQATEEGNDPTDGNGPNALIYNTKTLTLLASVGVGTPEGSTNGEYRQVVRYEFQPVGDTGSTGIFYVYVSHMKSGTTSADATDRGEEATIIRNDEATLPANSSVLYTGDLNSAPPEAEFTNFTASGQGEAYDPLNFSTSVQYYSESATDLRYRDDYELMTSNVLDDTGAINYVSGTLHSFGNNGTTPAQGSVNSGSDTALNSDLVQDGGTFISASTLYSDLTTASDHLPVVADYTISSQSASTTTTVTSTPASPIVQGTSIAFAAAVTGSPSVGTVTFYAGPGLTNPIGTPVNVVNGSASSASTTTLPVGTDTITAVYSGGTGFAGSQGTEPVVVNASSTFEFDATTATVNTVSDPGTVTLLVDRSGNTSVAQTVGFYTANSTATAGTDYTAVASMASPMTVAFPVGATQEAVTVPIVLFDGTPYSGTRTFSGNLENPSSGATLGSPATATVSIADPQLAIASVTDTPTGFVLQFNRQFNPTPLHLYTTTAPGATLTPASLTLTDSNGNLVYGTLVLDSSNTKATFVTTNENSGLASGAPLATTLTPGSNYTLNVVSAASAFEGLDGRLLTGTTTYSVTPPAANNFTLSVPDFARGPGESVSVPKTNPSAGVPIYLDSANGTSAVTSLTVTLQYNPTILNIASGAATLAPVFSAAGFAIANAQYNQAGTESGLSQVTITLSGGSLAPAAATQTPVLYLTATVPTGSSLGSKGVLDLVTAQVDTSAATPNDGVDVDAYFGNVTGSGAYTALDVTRVAQVSAQFDQNVSQNEYSGFASTATGQTSFALVDPAVLADITQHTGAVNSLDATRVAQQAVNPSSATIVPQLGVLPTNGSPVTGGVDPYVYIEPLSASSLSGVGPTASGSAGVGQTIAYAVHVYATQALTDFDAAGFAIQFDPSEFSIGSISTPLGGFSANANTNYNTTGKLNILLTTGGSGQPFSQGRDLVVATFTVTLLGGIAPGTDNRAFHLLANDGPFETGIDSNGSRAAIDPAPVNGTTNPDIDGSIQILNPSGSKSSSPPALNGSVTATFNLPKNPSNSGGPVWFGSPETIIDLNPSPTQATNPSSSVAGLRLTPNNADNPTGSLNSNAIRIGDLDELGYELDEFWSSMGNDLVQTLDSDPLFYCGGLPVFPDQIAPT